MGIYINMPNMPHHGKAQFIVDNVKGAIFLDKPEDVAEDHVSVWVTVNPLFDAAGIIYDEAEMKSVQWALDDPNDNRPNRWVSVPRVWVMNTYPGWASYVAV